MDELHLQKKLNVFQIFFIKMQPGHTFFVLFNTRKAIEFTPVITHKETLQSKSTFTFRETISSATKITDYFKGCHYKCLIKNIKPFH